MDHSKFEDLVKGLTRKVIVEKLTEDFEILDKFLIIKKVLTAVYYEDYVDLEVSIREMTEYDTPNVEQWKIVEKFGKTKYILHSWRQVLQFGKLFVRDALQLQSLL